MSTREEHPLDEFFRRSLANTEADPPAEVWAGIQAARHRRTWWQQWFRMNGILLLLVPAAAWVTYAAWPDRNTGKGRDATPDDDRIAVAGIAPETTSAMLAADEALIHREQQIRAGVNSGDPEQASIHSQESTIDNVPDVLSSDSPMRSEPGNSSVQPEEKTHTEVVDHSGELSVQLTSERTAGKADPGDRSMQQGAIAHDTGLRNTMASAIDLPDPFAYYISPLPIGLAYGSLSGEPKTVPAPSAYVLPKGDWILSLVIGTSDVKRDWRGTDRPLVKALDDAEAHTTTYGFGIQAGRSYRSGSGFSVGLINERSEQQFSYTDRRTEVSQHVVNYIVTLDSEVFISDPDTIDQVTTVEQRYQDIDRKTVYRVPLEGFYHLSAGRLYYGPRAGASLEFTHVRQKYSLVNDPDGPRIEVGSLSRTELRSRYPAVLSGSIGVDLGYHLAENWSFELSPVYMAGILPLTGTGDVWAAPSRLAVQFRLHHHFTTKLRK